jgi:uncharacterized protein (TIGR02145 family)
MGKYFCKIFVLIFLFIVPFNLFSQINFNEFSSSRVFSDTYVEFQVQMGGLVQYDGSIYIQYFLEADSIITSLPVNKSVIRGTKIVESFSARIINAKPNYSYQFRFVNIGTNGKIYDSSSYKSLTTKIKGNPISILVDNDGNTYKTVYLRNRLWMAENLKSTKLKDGSNITQVVSNLEWGKLHASNPTKKPIFSWYDNDINNKINYGALYNWHSQNACPVGWRVPTYFEMYDLNVEFKDGDLKEKGNINWVEQNADATNISGFTILPGGERFENGFLGKGDGAYIMTTGLDADYSDRFQSKVFFNTFNPSNPFRFVLLSKGNGVSIRCIEDFLSDSLNHQFLIKNNKFKDTAIYSYISTVAKSYKFINDTNKIQLDSNFNDNQSFILKNDSLFLRTSLKDSLKSKYVIRVKSYFTKSSLIYSDTLILNKINPPFIYDTSFTINDSLAINAKVGKIRSFDVDADVLIFKIKSGNTNETFKLDTLGNIYVNSKINFNITNKYDLVVSVSDGFDSTTAKVTINISPFPTFNHSGAFGVCTGDSLKVYTNKYTGYNIIWYKNGQIFNNQNIDTIYIKEAANYQIKIIKGADTISSVIKTFVINTIPSSPVASAKNLCQNETSVSLTANATSGNSLIWYGTNATGGSSSTTAPFISTASTGTLDYYVSQKNTTTGCESPRTMLSVTINPLPVSPTVRDTAFCQNSTSIVLSAGASSGNSLLWYGTNAIGGSSNINATVPITTSIGSYTYYVSQKNSTTGCESARSKIRVTINPLPLAPLVRDTTYCNNTNVDTLRFNALSGTSLLWYGTNATGGTGTITAIKPSTATVGTVNYYLSQIITTTGCIGPRSKLVVITKPLPNAPTISRDTANFLVSGTSATTWFKDGTALTDTAQKIKPTTPGSYTAKTTLNGCASALSNPYYYLVTDVINLSADEYIKLAPNPFINQLNFDFVVKGYQRLNLEVFDVATGMKKASMQNLTPGMPIYLGQLSTGTYYVRVSSKDGKINYQFKMIKL